MEELQRNEIIAQWEVDRSTYLNEVSKAKGKIEELIHMQLKEDLRKHQEYVNEFNAKGFLKAYLERLILTSRLIFDWGVKGQEKETIKTNLKDMKIKDCNEDCYAYLTKVRDIVKLYKKQVIISLKEQFQVEQLEGAAREDVEATIERISGDELDKDLEVIKAIYMEVMEYGLDNQGCNKYNDMMKHQDISRMETPFSVRTVTNGVVTGGLNCMLDEFAETVNRIIKENPCRKVYYRRRKITVNANGANKKENDDNKSNNNNNDNDNENNGRETNDDDDSIEYDNKNDD